MHPCGNCFGHGKQQVNCIFAPRQLPLLGALPNFSLGCFAGHALVLLAQQHFLLLSHSICIWMLPRRTSYGTCDKNSCLQQHLLMHWPSAILCPPSSNLDCAHSSIATQRDWYDVRCDSYLRTKYYCDSSIVLSCIECPEFQCNYAMITCRAESRIDTPLQFPSLYFVSQYSL